MPRDDYLGTYIVPFRGIEEDRKWRKQFLQSQQREDEGFSGVMVRIYVSKEEAVVIRLQRPDITLKRMS
jgi:hypothetical protein